MLPLLPIPVAGCHWLARSIELAKVHFSICPIINNRESVRALPAIDRHSHMMHLRLQQMPNI